MNQPKINNLKFDSLFEGAVKCLRNAQELCDESELLHNNGKYARSFALSHFAREELGKSFMLFRALVDISSGVKVDWKKVNRRFRDYKQKLLNDAEISLFIAAKELQRQEISPDFLFSGINERNSLKNRCLYTDWNNGRFTVPSEAITEQQSERNLSLAIYRVAMFSPLLVKLKGLKCEQKDKIIESYPKSMPSSPEELLNAVPGKESNNE